jgi:ribonuclease HIII
VFLGPSEAWRVRLSDVTMTFWSNGTVYSTGSESDDPIVQIAWGFIDSVAGAPFLPTERPFMVGMDESGKGELTGHIVLAGVLVPGTLSQREERIVGLAENQDGALSRLLESADSGA